MGKGKGAFEYWSCRVAQGKVLLEVGGGGLRSEIAQQGVSPARLPCQLLLILFRWLPVLKLAAAKM